MRQSGSLGGLTEPLPQLDLVEETIVLGGRDLDVLRPRDSEALIDEHAFEHEEFLPYWAELWPSGLALARRVAVRALHGARTLELGCGLALPSLAAALAGGRAVATDWSPQAIELARSNAARNGIAIEAERADWAAPDALVERAPWDVVLGADLLYEGRNAELLLPLLPRLLGPASELWLADPGRPPAGPFLEAAAETFEIVSSADPLLPQGGVHRLRKKVPDPDLALGGAGDLERAGGDAARTAEAMRDAAVEQQRVALLERVDLAVEVDLEAAARHVEQDLARGHLVLLGPAAAAARPLAHGHRLAREGAHAAGGGRVAVVLVLAAVAAHERGAAAAGGRAPQQPDRYAERTRDPLDRADAGSCETSLELAQEGVGEPGLVAELLERPSAFPAQRADPGAERRGRLVR